MLTEKAITTCLLDVLREYSDENHILTMGEIISKINARYGLNPDRRTIYSALETLIELGYDISLYKDNGKGYYLLDRQLEPSEAHLLSDAICTFPFISERQTAQLLRKIQSLLNVHNRRSVKNLTVVRADHKTLNKQVFYNIEMLDEAIELKKKVTFDYFDYGIDKKLHKRREKKYKVNPYGLVYNNEHYYLVCIMSRQDTLSLYRIDRIQNIEITDFEMDAREPNFDPHKAIKTALFSFTTGEVADIELLIEPKVLNDVIDKFGANITLTDTSDGRIKVTLRTSWKGMRYWALQYIESVEVIFPLDLRESIINIINNNWYTKTRKENGINDIRSVSDVIKASNSQ